MAMTASGMAAKIKAAMSSVSPVQVSGSSSPTAYTDALMLAMCQGILDEVTANSELSAITTDSGPAGAGIITGKVK
jgi:hypothetical protein